MRSAIRACVGRARFPEDLPALGDPGLLDVLSRFGEAADPAGLLVHRTASARAMRGPGSRFLDLWPTAQTMQRPYA